MTTNEKVNMPISPNAAAAIISSILPTLHHSLEPLTPEVANWLANSCLDLNKAQADFAQ